MDPTHNNQSGSGGPKKGGGSVKITTPELILNHSSSSKQTGVRSFNTVQLFLQFSTFLFPILIDYSFTLIITHIHFVVLRHSRVNILSRSDSIYVQCVRIWNVPDLVRFYSQHEP